MEVVAGAMGSLLPKLGELLVGEYKLHKGVKKDVGFLQSEMRSMQAALSKVGEVPWDQLDPQVKVWAGEVRELSYDMEDVVDSFLVRVEDSDTAASSNKIKQLLEEMAQLFAKGKARREIADAMKDIKDRALQVAGRRDRYKVDDVIANTSSSTNDVDPRLLALYKDQKELVGIEEARDELTKRLTDGDGHVSGQKLKIISICGPGGLGKTTLAKAVYDRIQTQYGWHGFVPVGRNPEVKKVLKDIFLELGKKSPVDDVSTLDERQLIDKLRELLENQRYFIVIDDIWDLKAWETIKCALLDNNRGSRVIITTRILDVAKETGDVYEHKPLTDDFSNELFYTRLFGGKDKCPKDQPAEVTEKILKKCRGMPLAIITIASLLAGKQMEDWSKVYTSIGFGHGDNTMKILSYSYYDLPCHIRPCLLHLSIYPEDSEIKKDTLIWKWIAEGFVAEEDGVGLFEIGERYFNELLNRSMILPVENSVRYAIYACRVHDMVLDMICFLSNEQNFVTILGSNEKYVSSQSNPRRLAVQTKDEKQQNSLANTCMPKLRSCYASMCHISVMPSLSTFQMLRVLDMKGCGSLRDCHLKHLGRLLQLRYLSLEGTSISELPEDVGDLRFLQSLDLKDTMIKELPQSIGLLRKLKRLRADKYWPVSVIVPNLIGNLTSLEELHLDIIVQSAMFLKELGKLTELRVLRCCLGAELDQCSNKTFVESICNLSKLQVLEINRPLWCLECKADADWQDYEAGYVPPRQLRVLVDVWGILFSSLPAWINSSLLPNLSYLKVGVDFKEQDWLILGSLPQLRYVSGVIPGDMEFSCGAFPNLRRCDINAPFRFCPGSMQSLDRIDINVSLEDAKTGFDFVGSLRNLPSLWVVKASILCGWARASVVEEVEAAFRQAIHTHPNRPTLDLERFCEMVPQKRFCEIREEKESDSELTEQESHNIVRDGPDSEQSSQNQDHPQDEEEAEATGAPASRRTEQQPDNEREAEDGSAEATAAALAEVQLSLSVGASARSPARRTTTGAEASAQVISGDGEEDRSQPDKEREAGDVSAEETTSEGPRSVEVCPDRPVSSLAASGVAAAGSQVAARRTWRQWACFACLDCGTASTSSKQNVALQGIDQEEGENHHNAQL